MRIWIRIQESQINSDPVKSYNPTNFMTMSKKVKKTANLIPLIYW